MNELPVVVDLLGSLSIFCTCIGCLNDFVFDVFEHNRGSVLTSTLLMLWSLECRDFPRLLTSSGRIGPEANKKILTNIIEPNLW